MFSSVGTLRKAYKKLPFGVRVRLAPLRRAYVQVQRMYLPLCVIRGNTQHGGLPLTFLYAGRDTGLRDYWIQQILGEALEVHFAGEIPCWKLGNESKMDLSQSSFALVEPNIISRWRLLGREAAFRIPYWIHMEIDISEPFEIMRKKSQSRFKDAQRLIRKHNLDFEISRSPSDFENFYFNMHVPFVRARFDSTGVLGDFDEVKRIMPRCEILFIRENHVPVAGALFEYHKGKVFLRKFGVLNGELEYVRHGVMTAVYYFGIIEMQKRGYKKIYIGGTRPLLNDGVTKFKLRWLAGVVPEHDPVDYLLLLLLRDSPALRDFLIHSPLIHYPVSRRPERVIWVGAEQAGSKAEFIRFLDEYDCTGLMGTQVFTFDAHDVPEEWRRSNELAVLEFKRMETLFSQR